MNELNLMIKIISFPSPNYNDRPIGVNVDILVLHYTGMPKTIHALKRMCNPVAKVSAHYLIDANGQIFQLVSEEKRAWHAGISFWRGNKNINDRSIGIELANPGHEFGYQKFPKPQIESLIRLAADIILRHAIPARNVVGHSDISPTRKKDPGEFLDWHELALNGIGHFPKNLRTKTTEKITESNLKSALEIYGYETSNLPATIRAFQRHFLPQLFDEKPNQELYKILKILINNL